MRFWTRHYFAIHLYFIFSNVIKNVINFFKKMINLGISTAIHLKHFIFSRLITPHSFLIYTFPRPPPPDILASPRNLLEMQIGGAGGVPVGSWTSNLQSVCRFRRYCCRSTLENDSHFSKITGKDLPPVNSERQPVRELVLP